MAEHSPDMPSPRKVLADTIDEQFSIVQPRTHRSAGIADPDDSVRAGRAVGGNRAIDTEPTARRIRRRVKFLAAFAAIPVLLVVAGIDELVSSGNPDALLGALLLVSPVALYAVNLAQMVRLLRRDQWREWPAAQMMMDSSRLPWFLQSNRVIRWMFQLFDFEHDRRFLISSSWYGTWHKRNFEEVPGKVWVCGDPTGRVVLAVEGGEWPTVFNARFFTTQRKFIEQEFASQFPPGRPDAWPESPDWQLPPQVEYKGPIIWPKPPGQTDEWDHTAAELKRSVRHESEPRG